MRTARATSNSVARLFAGILSILGPAATLLAQPADGPAAWAAAIRGLAKLPGGLCVHVGCGDRTQATAELLRELSDNGRFLVHAVEPDAAAVALARQRLHDEGIYGQVSIENRAAARLPYAENLVNLVVADDPGRGGLSLQEILRVLCPNGVAFVGQSARAARLSGQKLTRQALERQLAGAPRWDLVPIDRRGLWAMVRKPWPKGMDDWPQPRHAADGNAASGDRFVGPPRRVRWVAGPLQEISNTLSARGRNFYAGVIARDAFNGLRLWERALEPTPARGNYCYRSLAGSVQPIAAADRLVVFDRKTVRALDGATGKELRTYPAAGTPRELLHLDGALIAVGAKSLRAVGIDSGDLLWSYGTPSPSCVAAGDGGVFFLAGSARRGEPRAVIKLSAATGRQQWRRTDFPWAAKARRCVYHNGVLALEVSTFSDHKQGNAIHVLSAADGRELWARTYVPGMTHYKQARAMFTRGLLWILAERGIEGLDPRTGEVKHKHRAGRGHCYPPVATPRFLLCGEMNLTSLETGKVDFNPLTKGHCSRDAGFVPANGLIYVTPKHCACWPMLRGYAALAPARTDAKPPGKPALLLEKGPAFGRLDPPAANALTFEWPCYRHDPERSACSAAAVPAELKTLWSARLGGRPTRSRLAQDWQENPFCRGPVTSPVVADGTVVVARSDAHEVVALDAEKGTVRWRFTANGRIDTPPTLHRGLCLFGTRGGWVYCLRARDGALVWRLRAGPNEDRIVSFGQLESPWPVAGSILVLDGLAYIAAGRHPLADGGILVAAFEPATGSVRWTRRIHTLPFRGYYGGLGLEFDCIDLLVAETVRQGEDKGSKLLAMSRWRFEPKAGAMTMDLKAGFGYFETRGGGVLAPRGHYTYGPRQNYIGSSSRPGYVVPTRKERRPLVAFRGAVLYSASNSKRDVFRRDFTTKGLDAFDAQWYSHRRRNQRARKGGDVSRAQRLARQAKWRTMVFDPATALLAKQSIAAMALTDDKLFVVGAAGGLIAFSTADGRRLAQHPVPPPTWDGLAVAYRRLFLTTQEGQVVCLGTR